jgi:hypothetical protein
MHEILTHEDDLFGRVALFNGLVTLEQIVECARTLAAEIVAGRPRRPLAAVLIARGFLRLCTAGAIEAAIRRHLAGVRPAGIGGEKPSAPSPKLPPMSQRAPAGTSQIMIAPEQEEDDKPAEERMRSVVSRLVPGRIFPEILQYLVRHRVSVIDSRKLAAALFEPEKAVVSALHRWMKQGVLRRIGTHPYNFSPTQEREEEIRIFLDAWNDPRQHAHILGLVLEAEENR